MIKFFISLCLLLEFQQNREIPFKFRELLFANNKRIY